MSDFSEKVGSTNLEFLVTLDERTLATLVVALVDAGRPIWAVKLLRDALFCGLKQGKDIVDVARNAPRGQAQATVVESVQDAIERYCGL